MSESPAPPTGLHSDTHAGTHAGNGDPAGDDRGESMLTAAVGADATAPDLDAVDADLDGVDRALARLADGSYWTDEVTGEPLDPELLNTDPIARRSTPS